MACGTPAVCSNRSSLPEVAGAAAICVDPDDTGAIAEGLERVLNDVDLQRSLSEQGLERARVFSWERTARETLEVYRALVG
jgi:glycosyltransferase involved in cell wall biosynthesis